MSLRPSLPPLTRCSPNEPCGPPNDPSPFSKPVSRFAWPAKSGPGPQRSAPRNPETRQGGGIIHLQRRRSIFAADSPAGFEPRLAGIPLDRLPWRHHQTRPRLVLRYAIAISKALLSDASAIAAVFLSITRESLLISVTARNLRVVNLISAHASLLCVDVISSGSRSSAAQQYFSTQRSRILRMVDRTRLCGCAMASGPDLDAFVWWLCAQAAG